MTNFDYYLWLVRVEEARLNIEEALRSAKNRWPEDIAKINAAIRMWSLDGQRTPLT